MNKLPMGIAIGFVIGLLFSMVMVTTIIPQGEGEVIAKYEPLNALVVTDSRNAWIERVDADAYVSFDIGDYYASVQR